MTIGFAIWAVPGLVLVAFVLGMAWRELFHTDSSMPEDEPAVDCKCGQRHIPIHSVPARFDSRHERKLS